MNTSRRIFWHNRLSLSVGTWVCIAVQFWNWTDLDVAIAICLFSLSRPPHFPPESLKFFLQVEINNKEEEEEEEEENEQTRKKKIIMTPIFWVCTEGRTCVVGCCFYYWSWFFFFLCVYFPMAFDCFSFLILEENNSNLPLSPWRKKQNHLPDDLKTPDSHRHHTPPHQSRSFIFQFMIVSLSFERTFQKCRMCSQPPSQRSFFVSLSLFRFPCKNSVSSVTISFFFSSPKLFRLSIKLQQFHSSFNSSDNIFGWEEFGSFLKTNFKKKRKIRNNRTL